MSGVRADQFTLDLSAPPSYAGEDYVAAPANTQARAMLAALEWPTALGLLIGGAGSGKTHLAHLCAARFARPHWLVAAGSLWPASFDLLLIDDLDPWAGQAREDQLFHALEAARAARAPVLATTSLPPEHLGFRRPDTLSRLRAGLRAQILPPDDDLFTAIAIKLFSDRQLKVSPDIATYLLHRIERSYANLTQLVALLDRHALAAGRDITKSLARDVLEAFEHQGTMGHGDEVSQN